MLITSKMIFYILIRVRKNETGNGYHLQDLCFTSVDVRGTGNGGQEFGAPKSWNIDRGIPCRRDHSLLPENDRFDERSSLAESCTVI